VNKLYFAGSLLVSAGFLMAYKAGQMDAKTELKKKESDTWEKAEKAENLTVSRLGTGITHDSSGEPHFHNIP